MTPCPRPPWCPAFAKRPSASINPTPQEHRDYLPEANAPFPATGAHSRPPETPSLSAAATTAEDPDWLVSSAIRPHHPRRVPLCTHLQWRQCLPGCGCSSHVQGQQYLAAAPTRHHQRHLGGRRQTRHGNRTAVRSTHAGGDMPPRPQWASTVPQQGTSG